MALPYVMIELDKPRKLRCTMQAALEIEDTFNFKVLDLGQDIFQKNIAKTLWILLKQEDKDLTYEQAIEIMNEAETLSYLKNKVFEAVLAAFRGKESPNGQPPTVTEKANS